MLNWRYKIGDIELRIKYLNDVIAKLLYYVSELQ